MKKTGLLLFLTMLLTSCKKILLGKEEANTPENNFELLWKDFDRHYSLFYIKGTNWDSLYRVYRPQISSETTEYELWDIFTHLLENLNDSHTAIYTSGYKKAYVSGFALGRKAIDEEFDLNLVKTNFLEYLIKVKGEEDLSYGKLRGKEVGYIFLREEEGENPAGAIEDIIQKLKNNKAIILDLRTNDGGDARYSKIFAGGFSDGEHLVATVQTRNGPRHSDFNAKVNEFTQMTGKEQFLKPVILLTDRATISGGEYLTLHMKSFAHVTQIGDTTSGDFSAVGTRSFLPNGWAYQYSIQMLLLPNGKSLDGIGIAPDVYCKNTEEDIDQRRDRVMERALLYLFERYGIQ